MTTRGEFAICMALLSGGLGRPMPEEQAEAWYCLLNHLQFDLLKAAVERWLRENESTFFPAPATILRMADELVSGRLPGADEALTEFHEVRRRFDPFYQAIEFLNALSPLTRQTVIACGGPSWTSGLLMEDRLIYSSQFRKAFEAIVARSDRDRRLPERLRPRIAAAGLPDEEPRRLSTLFRIAPPDEAGAREGAA